jgi:ABC-type branched-subunit amino acid transport system ATPase component
MVLHDVSDLTSATAELVAVIGANGAGKDDPAARGVGHVAPVSGAGRGGGDDVTGLRPSGSPHAALANCRERLVFPNR